MLIRELCIFPVLVATMVFSGCSGHALKYPPEPVAAYSEMIDYARGDRFSWDNAAGADTFNVYRGPLSQVSNGASETLCLSPALPGTSQSDASPIADGLGWYYLVAGRNCAGESLLGSDSLGGPRVPAMNCP